jgi:hypothetical protein
MFLWPATGALEHDQKGRILLTDISCLRPAPRELDWRGSLFAAFQKCITNMRRPATF